MQTFPKHSYTASEPVELSGEEPKEETVHLSPEDIKKLEMFLAAHPELEDRFKKFKENLKLESIIKEEILRALRTKK